MDKNLFYYESESDIQKCMSDVQNIYEHIVDEKSREIYINRLLMAFTDDVKYLGKLIANLDAGKEFEDFLRMQDKIYVYGAGVRGKRLVRMFPDIKWQGYIDGGCEENICNGLAVLRPENVKLSKDDIILITNLKEFEEIKENLVSLGIQKSQIIYMNDFEVKAQEENQYFEKRCVSSMKNNSGIFVDAGCYDGRDCVRFLESDLYGGNPIYAFEPDSINYQKCNTVLNCYDNIQLFNLGLSDSKRVESFLSGAGYDSCVTSEGNSVIEMDTIDHIMRDKKIGFIKMDIEGCEKRALIGAEQHIRQDKPNLMVCIYHKKEDVIEIPKLVLEMNPTYKFAFGHYSVNPAETVMYAF